MSTAIRESSRRPTDPELVRNLLPAPWDGVLSVYLMSNPPVPQHASAWLLAGLCRSIAFYARSDDDDARDRVRQGIWELLRLPAIVTALSIPTPPDLAELLVADYAVVFERLFGDVWGVALTHKGHGWRREVREQCDAIEELAALPTVEAALAAGSVGQHHLPNSEALSALLGRIREAADDRDFELVKVLASAIEAIFAVDGDGAAPSPPGANPTMRPMMKRHWDYLRGEIIEGRPRDARDFAVGVDVALDHYHPDLAAAERAELHKHLATEDLAAASAQYDVIDAMFATFFAGHKAYGNVAARRAAFDQPMPTH